MWIVECVDKAKQHVVGVGCMSKYQSVTACCCIIGKSVTAVRVEFWVVRWSAHGRYPVPDYWSMGPGLGSDLVG